MTITRNFRCTAVRVALLAAAALPLFAFASPKNVPFKASLVTQESFHPNPAECRSQPFLQGTLNGSGNASHMGHTSAVATDCITPVTQTYFTFNNGKLILTAANGDELTADYSGYLSFQAAPSTFAVTGTFKVTGGTGRFSDASGSGTISGSDNINTGQGQIDLAGTISY